MAEDSEICALSVSLEHLTICSYYIFLDLWVLGKLPVPGRPTNLIIVGQGLTVLTVGAGGGCLDIFTLLYHFSLSLGDGPI